MSVSAIPVKPTPPSQKTTSIIPMDRVVVHPLVLLSVVDHFNRIGKVGSQSRVVGALLGQWKTIDGKKLLDVSNSFAVPFDEDVRDRDVWYLDHDYLETMYAMFKKVNARERIVGWYHTGPKLCPNDIAINDLIKRYNPNAVLIIIDAKPKDLGLPTEAYIAVEEVHDDGTPTTKTFEHVPSAIDAEEAEEVGVEHLLRDIHNVTVGSLSQRITNQLQGLKGLSAKLVEIKNYLEKVATDSNKIKFQNSRMYIVHYFHMGTVTNDQMLVVYLASLIRSVIALHNLINNKISTTDAEKSEGKPKKVEENKNDKKSEKLSVDSTKKPNK